MTRFTLRLFTLENGDEIANVTMSSLTACLGVTYFGKPDGCPNAAGILNCCSPTSNCVGKNWPGEFATGEMETENLIT